MDQTGSSSKFAHSGAALRAARDQTSDWKIQNPKHTITGPKTTPHEIYDRSHWAHRMWENSPSLLLLLEASCHAMSIHNKF